MKHFLAGFRPTILVALSVLLAACGGSGGGSSASSTPSGDLRTRVARSIEEGFTSQASVQGGGTSGGLKLLGDTPEFDYYYQLWAKPVDGGFDYFVDEQLTEPAGTSRYSNTFDDNGNFLSEGSIEILKGVRAGFRSTLRTEYVNGRIEYAYTGTDPETGTFQTTGYKDAEGGLYETRLQGLTGPERVYRMTFKEDGTSVVEYNTDRDYRYTLNFAADRSGTGTVTGDSSLLPATITWDVEGTGTLTFADQSKLEFTGFDFNQI